MNKAFAIKLSIIALIAILLNFPLNMVSLKSQERNSFKAQAQSSVANNWTGTQTLIGPIIKIPYTQQDTVKIWDKNLEAYTDIIRTSEKSYWVVAESIGVDSKIKNKILRKGIYEIPVFTSSIDITGVVKDDYEKNIRKLGDVTKIGDPVMSFTISDSRGINSIPKLKFDNSESQFKSSSNLLFNTNGIHVPVSADLLKGGKVFSLNFDIRGMQSLSFVPVAREVTVNVESEWPHPSFIGDFLPLKRDVNSNGYNAVWKVTSFSNEIESKVLSCSNGDCGRLINSSFGVKHIDPVDIYSQSERAIKYAFLFIVLSFVTFFMFEVLKNISIHSVQYTLVGCAVAIFYLLLLALAEHLSFFTAYIIATASCVALLQVYLSAILKSVVHAGLFSCIYLVLYGLLYLIIQSEDFALLMGGVLTFMTLVALMVGTRNVNWFEVGE